ncbi:MAG: hypothetical protein AAFO93_05400 [Pseudomonadota bacterium]
MDRRSARNASLTYQLGRHQVRVLGPLAFNALLFFGVYSIFQVSGVSGQVAIWTGVFVIALLNLAVWFARRRRLHRTYQDAARLHSQVHDLELQAKALEIEEARRKGAFDRFGSKS